MLVARAAKIINENCPSFCPCCKNGKQSLLHWTVCCPYFKIIRRPVSNYSRRILRVITNLNSDVSNNNPILNNENDNTVNNSVDNVEVDVDDNMMNNNMYNNPSVFNKVFNFLLGERSIKIHKKQYKGMEESL